MRWIPRWTPSSMLWTADKLEARFDSSKPVWQAQAMFDKLGSEQLQSSSRYWWQALRYDELTEAISSSLVSDHSRGTSWNDSTFPSLDSLRVAEPRKRERHD
jgi:hypothetical protein